MNSNIFTHPPLTYQTIQAQATLDTKGYIYSMIISTLIVIRPLISSIAAATALSVYLATSSSSNMKTTISLFLVVFLTSAYGFILNDYFDLDKDRLQHPNRVIPRGKISPRLALCFAFICGLCSVTAALQLPPSALIIDVITLSSLGFYSFVNRSYGALANAITALNSAFVLLIGMVTGEFSARILLTSIATFFLIFGREIILDLRDADGDRAFGKASIPIDRGKTFAIGLTSLLLLSSTIVVTLTAIWFGNWSFRIFVGMLFTLVLWISFLNYVFRRNTPSLQFFLTATRLSFVLIIPGILL